MEWDLKVPPPPWSLEELDRDPGLSIGSVVVGSAALCRTGESDCSVDLKLGGLGEFGSSNKWNGGQSSSAAATAAATTTSTSVTVAMAMAMMPPPSPPSKRQRAPASGAHGAACSVDGCRADLSKCREYHRRHKVCEAHSKTPVVVVRGQEQRFCQQCSRFHLLEEFDEVKRSCRKRLDGHNRRRRKPQPGSGNAGSLFPDLQATGFSTYPQIFLNAAPESNWTRIVKTEDTALYSPPQFINQQHFPSPSCVFSNERKQITFFQDGETGMGSKSTQNSADQMNLRTTAPLRSSGSSKIFNDRLTQVFDSDCALSLLSSPIQTSDINLSHIVSPSDQIPVAQPLISSLQYGGLMQYSLPQATNNVTPTGFSCAGRMEEPNVGTALVSDHATDTEINCHSMFHVDHEGSDSACQTLPFSWP